MSIQDRPICNICCTEIKYGEKKKHGPGRCDSDAAHSKMNNQIWKCRRCGAIVDMVAFRCNCTESPSPWELVGKSVSLNSNLVDYEYCRLLENILELGKRKKNRTGVDTIGIFGEQAKFEVDMDAFPILTTKKVWFKGIVHELLWFLKGDTNIKYLVDNDVHIWDEWAYKRYTTEYPKLIESEEHNIYTSGYCAESKEWILYTQNEFVKKIKDDNHFAKTWGELGEGTYGGMWRNFPYYTQHGRPPTHCADIERRGRDCSVVSVGHVDQIQKVMDKLKTNPDDRRMIVSAWHPYWVDHCALPPCHCLFHFNTEELTEQERIEWWLRKYTDCKGISTPPHHKEDLDKCNVPTRRVNLLLYQRSCDTFLGVPFNITSYSLLLAMVAHCMDMVPGEFTHTYGDLHIYENHMEQVKEQLHRTPMKLPQLWLNPDKKDLRLFDYDDIKLINYNSHPAIKAPIAV